MAQQTDLGTMKKPELLDWLGKKLTKDELRRLAGYVQSGTLQIDALPAGQQAQQPNYDPQYQLQAPQPAAAVAQPSSNNPPQPGVMPNGTTAPTVAPDATPTT